MCADETDDTSEDPDDEGEADGPGLLEDALGGNEDAGTDDGAQDDGDATEEAELPLQLHLREMACFFS